MASAQPTFHPVTLSAGRDAPARALIDRQMAKLERLAEIGMEIAEAAGRMARQIEAGAAGADAADPALSYSRAARAVRLTIALQSRLAKDLAGLDRDEAAVRAGKASARRHDIHRRIEAITDAERDDTDAVGQIAFDAWERLTDEDDADILDQPIEAVVARICADLGLSSAVAAEFAGADALTVDPDPMPRDAPRARSNLAPAPTSTRRPPVARRRDPGDPSERGRTRTAGRQRPRDRLSGRSEDDEGY